MDLYTAYMATLMEFERQFMALADTLLKVERVYELTPESVDSSDLNDRLLVGLQQLTALDSDLLKILMR